MKRNKIISILEYSARNKMLVGILAVSLIGAGGVFLSSQGALSNNTMEINKTVLAGTLNNDGNKACIINGNDSLVLYTSPGNSSIQSYVSVGEMLTINSYSNGYYNVTVQETGATGYIASSNMQKIVSGVGYDLTSLSGTAYVTNVSTVVNLREEATMNSTTLLKLKNDTSVELLGKQGDWYKVEDNGTTGYIYGEYIAIANITSNSSSSSSTTTSSSTSKTTGTTKSNSSNSSTKATSSKSSTSTTSKASNTGSSSSSNSSNNTTSQNTLREQNNNKLSSYLGNWEVSKDVGHSIEGMTENATSLIGTKLQITNSTYSFNGVTITNPYYYVETVSTRDLFGQDGSVGALQNQQTLEVLVVSSKPLTASEVQIMAVNDSHPTIILNNSNIYIFGGGENYAQIDSTTKLTSCTSGTTSNTGNSTSSSSGITIGSSTSDSTLFSDNYQKLYYSIGTGLNLESLPGPELVTNLDNYITINGENYYYVYTPTIDDYNMGGIPMDSANGNFSQIGTGEYVNAEGVALPKSDYSLIGTATHSENINNLSSNEIIDQLSRITSEYINCYVARGSIIENGICTGPYANMNNNVQTVTVNLNDYKIFNGEKAYSVTVNSKDNTQLYVALNGYVYISTENGFANVSNAQHLTQKQWKQAIKGI